MRSRSAMLTGQERNIMKIVWERESATVRDIYEALLEKRKVLVPPLVWTEGSRACT